MGIYSEKATGMIPIAPSMKWGARRGCARQDVEVVVVTADTDFIPAMKFARREGVQVVIVPMGTRMLNKVLLEHADGVRVVKP